MPNNYLRTDPINRLFLICPTDCIEQPIHQYFDGNGYFYTALGAYFEFDFKVQSTLWELICDRNIKEVIFVTAINNLLYQDVFDRNEKHNYPVDQALEIARNEITNHTKPHKAYYSNYHLLVAHHLKKQKHRLLSTHYLGNRLRDNNIDIDVYVYQPNKEKFCSHREIEETGYLLNSISYN